MLTARIAFSAFFCLALVAFQINTASVEGRWICRHKAGQWDERTNYQINCSGEIVFYENGALESSCTDALIPTGSTWSVRGNEIVLSDSEGAEFMWYQYELPDERTLVLVRKGVRFTFEKVFVPVPAQGGG